MLLPTSSRSLPLVVGALGWIKNPDESKHSNDAAWPGRQREKESCVLPAPSNPFLKTTPENAVYHEHSVKE